jgi:chitodextrinase
MSSISMTQLANAAVTYVQGIAGNGSSSGSSWSTTFASAQTAGNLNVVAVGWADATRTVTSVVDSKGNTYTLAVGPARSTGNATEYIYYAKNIVAAAAGTNTVTVTVSGTGTIVWPDIRVAEYSGLDTSNPLDVAIGNSGSGTTATTGNFTTTNASDLIVGYAFIQNTVTGAGSGYTSRVPDGGDMLEDRTTTSAGTYSATAPIDISGWWVMSAVAFKAAATADVVAPTVPTGLTPAVASSSQINLSWIASTDNVGVTGYSIERCGSGCSVFSAGLALSYADTGLTASTTYTYRVRATDAAANFSAYTSTVSATTAAAGPGSVQYEYDGVGRLKWAQFTNGKRTTYSLDAAGNRNNVTTEADSQDPDIPGTLTVSDLTTNSATVQWGASNDNFGVAGYEYRINTGAWQTLGNVTSVNLTGLSITTAYSFDVRAFDGAGRRSLVRSGGFTTLSDTSPPGTPGPLTFSSISSTTATATWTNAVDNVGIAGYDYRVGSTGSWISLGNVLSVGLTNLNPSTSYTVYVRARDTAGLTSVTPRSNSFTTLADTTPPSQPGAITIQTITPSTVTFSWGTSTDNVGIDRYEYSVDNIAWTTVGTATSATATGLLESHGYPLYVRAWDRSSNVSPLSSTAFTTGDATPPSAPGAISIANITANAATAAWIAATDYIGVVGYSYRIDTGGWVQLGNVLSVDFSGLSDNASHTFELKARDAAGNIGPSRTATFTTLDGTPPSAPGTVTFTNLNETSVTVSWSAATDNVIVLGYRLRLSEGAQQISDTDIGNVLTYSLTGLGAGRTYTVEIRARDARSNIGSASSGTVTTPDNVPPAPTSFSAESITTTSASLFWLSYPFPPDVVSNDYQLNGGSWIAIGVNQGVQLTNLAPSTTYTVNIRQRDATGHVSPNLTGTFSTLDGTPPTPPTSLTFYNIGSNVATAAWGASTDNIGVVGYSYSLDGGAWVQLGNVLNVTLTGLSDANHTFSVRARDAIGNTGTVVSGSFRTLDSTAPSVPGALTFSGLSETTFTASWGAASDNVGVTGYRFRMLEGSTQLSDTSVGNTLSTTISSLPAGHTYTIQIVAYDAAGNLGTVRSGTVTLPDYAPPPPTSISAESITSTSAGVRWLSYPFPADVVSNDYQLNGGQWIALGVTQGVDLTNLTPSTAYTVTVRQRDANGNVSTTVSVQFTTTETWIPITNAGGAVLASAASLYGRYNDCYSEGETIPYCVTQIYKLYGNHAVVFSWTQYYGDPNPPAGNGLPGYRQLYPALTVEANSATYGH